MSGNVHTDVCPNPYETEDPNAKDKSFISARRMLRDCKLSPFFMEPALANLEYDGNSPKITRVLGLLSNIDPERLIRHKTVSINTPYPLVDDEAVKRKGLPIGEVPAFIAKLPDWPGMVHLDADRLVGIRVNVNHENSNYSDRDSDDEMGIHIVTASPRVAMTAADWQEFGYSILDIDQLPDRTFKIIVNSQDNNSINMISFNGWTSLRVIEDLMDRGAVPLFWFVTNFDKCQSYLYMSENQRGVEKLFMDN